MLTTLSVNQPTIRSSSPTTHTPSPRLFLCLSQSLGSSGQCFFFGSAKLFREDLRNICWTIIKTVANQYALVYFFNDLVLLSILCRSVVACLKIFLFAEKKIVRFSDRLIKVGTCEQGPKLTWCHTCHATGTRRLLILDTECESPNFCLLKCVRIYVYVISHGIHRPS